jgi:hypothetical protein
MKKLSIDNSIQDAQANLVWFEQLGKPALKPCLELSFETGILKLTYEQILNPFEITHESVRFEVSEELTPSNLRAGLAVGGDLRLLIDEVRCAALIDCDLLTACRTFCTKLDTMYSRGLLALSGPALTPYDSWTYGIEFNGFCSSFLAFPTPGHVEQFKKEHQSLIEYRLEDFLSIGQSPVSAQICAAVDDHGYQFMREQWISTAINSLDGMVDRSITKSIQQNTFPDYTFQSAIFLADRLYVIQLDVSHGLRIDSASASAKELDRVRREVSERGEAQFNFALKRLRARLVEKLESNSRSNHALKQRSK